MCDQGVRDYTKNEKAACVWLVCAYSTSLLGKRKGEHVCGFGPLGKRKGEHLCGFGPLGKVEEGAWVKKAR